VPRVSHEGLAFDAAKSMYFVDELNGGSVYKFVSANPNASTGDDYFAKGQTFALKVGAGGQFEGNNGPAITGSSVWVAITDAVAMRSPASPPCSAMAPSTDGPPPTMPTFRQPASTVRKTSKSRHSGTARN
jgi:hypothetical protein